MLVTLTHASFTHLIRSPSAHAAPTVPCTGRLFLRTRRCSGQPDSPQKSSFFAWLLSRGLLNTRSYLHHRNIRSLDESWCAHCPGVLETDAHIFSGCHRARGVWARLGISVPDAIVRRPWDIGVNVPLPDAVRLDIVLLILWHLWKCRNAVVFDQNDSGSLDVLTRVDRDMDAWMSRYRKVSPSVQQWKAWLNHCASASPM